LDVPCMLAESGTQSQSVLVGLVETKFCLGQVACVPIPVAFSLVPGRLYWILLWSLFSVEPPLEKTLDGDPIRFFVLKIISGW